MTKQKEAARSTVTILTPLTTTVQKIKIYVPVAQNDNAVNMHFGIDCAILFV